MACSHTHMFAACLITCLNIKRYQFTGRDMPLQKSSGVAILVFLQECGFFRPRTVHRETNSEKPQVKIRFAFHLVERNKATVVLRGYVSGPKVMVVSIVILFLNEAKHKTF